MALLLAVGFFLGRFTTRDSLNTSNRDVRNQPVKQVQYINKQDGYRFIYPSAWLRLSQAGLSKLGKDISAGLVHQRPAGLITVRVTKIKKGAALDSLPEQLDQRMAKEFKDFQKLGHQFVTVGKERALRYTYSFSSKNNVQVKQSQQILLNGDKAYYLLLHSTSESFDRLQPDWEQIAASFQIN